MMATVQLPPSDFGGESATQSLKQLKANLKDALRKSGVLNSVKAQIRREFILGLSEKHLSKFHHGDATLDLRERLSLSVIYHFLRDRNFNHSLSVFAAECGLDSKSAWLSEVDIIRSLKFGTKSEVYRVISEKVKKNKEENDLKSQIRSSVFDVLLDNLSPDSQDASAEISSQTEAGTYNLGPRESLEHQMQNLRNSFISRRDAEKAAPAKSIEERLIQFQRECEEKYRRDSENYVNYMRDTEITKVRLEEAQKLRAETDIIRKELESDYQRRLHEHAERESASIRSFADRDRQVQQSQYEARQLMQREIDDLRDREKSGHRKLESESQGLRSLELRLQESKAVIEAREREVGRREKLAEDLLSNNVERAKAEARAFLRSEMENVGRERILIEQEKQHLHDIKASQEVLLESAGSTRKMLRDAQAELLLREDEISAFRLKINSMSERMSKYPEDWVETNESEASKIRALSDQHSVAIELMHDENDKLKQLVQSSQYTVSVLKQKNDELVLSEDKNKAIIEKLKKAVFSERNAFSTAKLKNDEMVRLLKDQKVTISSLVKQNAGTFRSQGMKTSMDDLTAYLSKKRQENTYDHQSAQVQQSNSQNSDPQSYIRGVLPEQPYLQRNAAFNPLREDFRFHGQIQDPYTPPHTALPSYHPITLQEYHAREDQQRENMRMREEREIDWQRDMQRDRERERDRDRDRERGRSTSPNPAPYPQHSAQSSYQHTAAESPYGQQRGTSQGMPGTQRYTAHTAHEELYAPLPTATAAGATAMRNVRMYETSTSGELLSSAMYGSQSAGSSSDVRAGEDTESRRLMEVAVTERLERERVSEQAEKKAKTDRLEMDKMKNDMDRQRREMEAKEEEWKAQRERERARGGDRRGAEAASRRKAAEEQDIIAIAERAEERNQREAEQNANREKEKDRILEVERESVREKIEEKKRQIEMEEEAESRRKFFEDEERRFNEISEAKKRAAVDLDLEREMADLLAKESVLSELKDRKENNEARSYQNNPIIKKDNKSESSDDESTDSRYTGASNRMASVPISIPNAKYVQQSVEFRDSLDSPGMRSRGPWQKPPKISDDVTILKSTSERPSVENSVDSSHSTLSARDLGSGSGSGGTRGRAPLSPDVGEGSQGRSGGVQGAEGTVPRMIESTDSDAWLANSKDEAERGGKESAILKFDGLTTRELLNSSYQAQENAQAESAAVEEGAAESEQDRITRQRASAEQEKKDADDRAIQDARASVIARRKQKSEREAIAASLSCLPVHETEKTKPPAVSASMPSLSAAKFKSYSSSEESPDEKALNTSKSVLGLFEDSVEIESVEDSAEENEDSSGGSTW